MKLTNYKSLNDLFVTLGNKHHRSPEVIKKVYDSVFSFMKVTVKGLPELKGLPVENIAELGTNFFIPKFCRFFIDLKKLRKKRELNIIKYK